MSLSSPESLRSRTDSTIETTRKVTARLEVSKVRNMSAHTCLNFVSLLSPYVGNNTVIKVCELSICEKLCFSLPLSLFSLKRMMGEQRKINFFCTWGRNMDKRGWTTYALCYSSMVFICCRPPFKFCVCSPIPPRRVQTSTNCGRREWFTIANRAKKEWMEYFLHWGGKVRTGHVFATWDFLTQSKTSAFTATISK